MLLTILGALLGVLFSWPISHWYFHRSVRVATESDPTPWFEKLQKEIQSIQRTLETTGGLVDRDVDDMRCAASRASRALFDLQHNIKTEIVRLHMVIRYLDHELQLGEVENCKKMLERCRDIHPLSVLEDFGKLQEMLQTHASHEEPNQGMQRTEPRSDEQR